MTASAAPTRPPPQSAKPRSVAAPAVASAGLSLPAKTGRKPAIVMNCVEGWGKTTCAAYAENSAIIMAPQETGYLTLFEHGLAPERPKVIVESWEQLLSELDALIAAPEGYGTLAIDALGGMERLCFDFVCRSEFDGDWGEKGFASYQRGYDRSLPEWLKLLDRLDKYRTKHNATILMLSHCKVRPFKNPMGADFDRYQADCHEKIWGLTHKWADAVFFGTFFTVVDSPDAAKKKKGKGIGGTERIIYTERRDAFDAKNRFSMAPDIMIPNEPAQAWSAITAALKGKAAS